MTISFKDRYYKTPLKDIHFELHKHLNAYPSNEDYIQSVIL